MDRHGNNITNLQEQAHKLESGLDSARQELRTHERQIDQHTSDINQANFRIGANEQRIADLRRYIGDVEAKIDAMQGEINRLENKIEEIPRITKEYHTEVIKEIPGDPDKRDDKTEGERPPETGTATQTPAPPVERERPPVNITVVPNITLKTHNFKVQWGKDWKSSSIWGGWQKRDRISTSEGHSPQKILKALKAGLTREINALRSEIVDTDIYFCNNITGVRTSAAQQRTRECIAWIEDLIARGQRGERVNHMPQPGWRGEVGGLTGRSNIFYL